MKENKKRLSERKWPTFFIVCAISLAILIGGYLLYQNSIEGVVSGTTKSFMNQLADHDIRNVGSQVDSQLNYLRSLAKRMGTIRDEDQMDLPYLLSVEAQATAFQKLYFITREGKTYDSTYLVSSLNKMPWAATYQAATGDFVSRLAVDKREAWGEYLLYGLRLDTPITYGKEQVEGIAGLIPIEELDGLTSLESFDGRGTTLVIQPSGEIITASKYYDSETSRNYFTELKQAKFMGTASMSQCEAAIAQGKSFYAEYVFEGVQYGVILKPMGDATYNNGWYMAVKVPSEVTAEVTQVFLKRSLFFFAILCIVLIIIITFVLRTVRAAQVAKASEQAKSAFLANMSHEIRTPLNGITGLIYLMRQNLDNRERQKEYLEKAEVSAEFLKSVITDVLDMSKIESGQLELYSERMNLKKLLREIQMLVGPQAEAREQHFEIDCEGMEINWVMGDEVRLKQIIVNLLGNALKFTPAGGKISLIVNQRPHEETAETFFKVIDTGCGMSAEFLERIWQPFEQERRIGSQNGTGLGTTLSKILAEEMGGTIGVESRPGEGTTFTVRIPFPVAGQEDTQASSEPEDQKTLAGKRILVVEDNDINREILMEILAGYEAAVECAVNGQEAVDLFTQSQPYWFDVILMDIQMPVLNGYEATEAIRALERPDSKETIIIALTANAFKEEADRALGCGMNGVVTKPLDVNMLLAKLSELDIKNAQKRENN
ncbi:ATP-binding protein [Anaerovorax odorimutans]|uniref:Stage 0 sporulation protein A homolog n=1 Tax=Anaerovorax odorimutans TaxID=109327 RepID=A0ABT1RRZ9_9FIRM|nr:ATP-binding protein [Anaerovorax odorimutans]MCQ4637980.1 ATP-binding protein [Anaerovorax odorimutans]